MQLLNISSKVPLGVCLQNENKLDEMGKILYHYMTLVPSECEVLLPNGSSILVDNTQFHSILFGGDQLTVARIRGTKALRDTEENPVHRLEGVTPVIEDWHALLKVCGMLQYKRAKNIFFHFVLALLCWQTLVYLLYANSQAIWKRLYKQSSSTEGGTMFQLRNFINRTNVPIDPQKNTNASTAVITRIYNCSCKSNYVINAN